MIEKCKEHFSFEIIDKFQLLLVKCDECGQYHLLIFVNNWKLIPVITLDELKELMNKSEGDMKVRFERLYMFIRKVTESDMVLNV